MELADLPDLLVLVKTLGLTPVMEGVSEAKASKVRSVLENLGRKSARWASLGLRLPGFQHQMLQRAYAQTYMECLEQACFVRKPPTLLGLAEHPEILSIAESNRRNKHVKFLRYVLCRAVLSGQFAEITARGK